MPISTYIYMNGVLLPLKSVTAIRLPSEALLKSQIKGLLLKALPSY